VGERHQRLQRQVGPRRIELTPDPRKKAPRGAFFRSIVESRGSEKTACSAAARPV
jgi:hypothetical protein